MAEAFRFDVFLSHSSKDKATVRSIAERLRADGLSVWFDSWAIQPGDNIPAAIEAGLEESRVLVLCMSASAFGSDWAQLEAGTFRFRDPLNKSRRFIPLRLDESPIKGSLAQFLYLDWDPRDREAQYSRLLRACRASLPPSPASDTVYTAVPSKVLRLSKGSTMYAFNSSGKRALTSSTDGCLRLWDLDSGRCLKVVRGRGRRLAPVAWSPDLRYAITGSDRPELLNWELETPRIVRTLSGHTTPVFSASWTPDQKRAISGEANGTILLWDLASSSILRRLIGHTNDVFAIACAAHSERALSGSRDGSVRLWDLRTGRCLRVFEVHTHAVRAIAWSPSDRLALSASGDCSLRLLDPLTGRCDQVLRGHTSPVLSVAWISEDLALSGSEDTTVRLWNVRSGECTAVLQGHRAGVRAVSWIRGQKRAISADYQGRLRTWDLGTRLTSSIGQASRLQEAARPDAVQYTNAKVLLVGEQGVGKSGLFNYLAHGIRVDLSKPLPSTDGVWATHWPLTHERAEGESGREIWLWDFAGQVDYRLVQQIFMEDTAAAVLVFNPQHHDPLDALGVWDHDLTRSTRKPFAKILVAARIDRGGLVISDERVSRFIAERGFYPSLQLTSSLSGDGCDALRHAIVSAIDWSAIPETTSTALYLRMKEEILGLRTAGLTIIRLSELKQRMEMTLADSGFNIEQLEAAVLLLSGPGMIKRLDFGDWILLRPEVLSRYAAAMVRRLRRHPQGLGCIREDELLGGQLDYQDFERLPPADEAVVLRALLDLLVSRAWCLREPYEGTHLLVFPSYFRRERSEQPGHPVATVSYRFLGPIDGIYATLVVRLSHTVAFATKALWNSAADFQTLTGAALGFTLARDTQGSALLEIYFEAAVEEDTQVLFLAYVHEHLSLHATEVQRQRRFVCKNRKCKANGVPFPDQSTIDMALSPGGPGRIYCPTCGKVIRLRDAVESKFTSEAVREKVRSLQLEGQQAIDNESREMLAVHHIGYIVSEAGQIFRPLPNSDHGIDGEIEFKDDSGCASGRRLYVQIKSGDSHVRRRGRDGAEVFDLKNARWAEYWRRHSYPVMLAIRSSDGEFRWMDVSAYLERATKDGPVRQIAFSGERLDVTSVLHWRAVLLGKQPRRLELQGG